jgi:hypothetical protein
MPGWTLQSPKNGSPFKIDGGFWVISKQPL